MFLMKARAWASATILAATAAFVTVTSASDVQATPLATLDIAGDFTYSTLGIAGGSILSVDGTYAGDISGFSDPSLVRPMMFSAEISADVAVVGGSPIFSGTLLSGSVGPFVGSGDDLLGIGAAILTSIDSATSGFSTALIAYIAGNTGLPFELAPGYGLTFSYTGSGLPGSGTYMMDITSASGYDTLGTGLSDLVSGFGGPSFPDVPIEGSFDAAFAIAAVPLPATLPLLAAGGIALFGVGRARRKRAA